MSEKGHKRTFSGLRDIRYSPESGHQSQLSPCLLWAISGHVHRKRRSAQHVRRSPEPQIGASPRWLRRSAQQRSDSNAKRWLAISPSP